MSSREIQNYTHFDTRFPVKVKKDKVIPVTGRGGRHGCETSRLPLSTIGSQMAVWLSNLRAGRHLPQKDSWYSFLLEVVSTPGP
jgi:hypothetical protein